VYNGPRGEYFESWGNSRHMASRRPFWASGTAADFYPAGSGYEHVCQETTHTLQLRAVHASRVVHQARGRLCCHASLDVEVDIDLSRLR
jgi:hypothetical protein